MAIGRVKITKLAEINITLTEPELRVLVWLTNKHNDHEEMRDIQKDLFNTFETLLLKIEES